MSETVSSPEVGEFRWQALYRVGGVAALLSAVFLPIQIAVFVIWPPPLQGTALDWFTLFQRNILVGLLDLDLLLVVDNVLLVPIFLALYVALRRASESWAALATALGFVGLMAFIASNPAVEMLSLNVPTVGVYISVFSVLFLWIWYILIARGFFRLART